jgi:hypothetical protein
MGLFALAETVEFPCGKVLSMSASGRFCCKSRKSNNRKNLAKVDLWTSLPLRAYVFRSAPNNGHRATTAACPFGADIVAKVFLGWRTKVLRAVDAFYA